MTEYALKECVFHFNKKHLEDSSIPMWVLKFNGDTTLYINHLTANIPWSTKETISNPHTKGSIKFKNCLLTINDDNDAELRALTKEDKERLKKAKGPYARIVIDSNLGGMKKYMDSQEIEYSTIKKISGGCGTLFYICDIYKQEDAALLSLIYSNNYRILQPNEEYYKWYEEKNQEETKVSVLDRIANKLFSNNTYTEYNDDGYILENADESDWEYDDDDDR